MLKAVPGTRGLSTSAATLVSQTTKSGMIGASSMMRLRQVAQSHILPLRAACNRVHLKAAVISHRTAAMATATESDMAPYDALCTRLREIRVLEEVSELLVWDEMVMMPEGAAELRGPQKAALSGVHHEKATHTSLGELLDKLEGDDSLSSLQKCVIRESRRSYNDAIRISKEQVQRKGVLDTEAYEAWVKARTEKDFSLFAPKLAEMFSLVRELAQTKNPSGNLYTTCMDEFEKGMTMERIDEIFSELKKKLPPLIAGVRASPTPPTSAWMVGEYDVKQQEALCDSMCKDMGFSASHGRLDVSVHPFTTGVGTTDVRMTTRFKPDDLMEGLLSAIHECGHAMYEQGCNTTPEYKGLPVSHTLSLGMHESQSLFWERMVALCPAFAQLLLPKLQAAFPGFGDGKDAHDLYQAMNKMKDPSMIRVDSDELTYPMHIIIRYEIERDLVLEKMAVEDVPKVWNAKMQEYLGCTPSDDAEGCLQDIHWGMGSVGYFPTYTLGAAIAVQLHRQMEKDMPTMHEEIACGNFTPILEWLREKVHARGSVPACSDDLLLEVTGEPLNVSYFVDYLTKKYTDLYSSAVVQLS